MIEKNKTYTMEITGVGEKGEGIGRVDGFAVFVPYALVGEVVEVLIVKVQKSYAFGKINAIIKPSPYRITPKCPVFYRCGGCDYHHCTYELELKNKKQKVKERIEHGIERIRKWKRDGISINTNEFYGYHSKYKWYSSI